MGLFSLQSTPLIGDGTTDPSPRQTLVEIGFLGGDRHERVQQVAGGSRQPVEPRHHQHVAGFKRLDHAAKLRAVGLGSAYVDVAVHLLASGLGELPLLCVNALALAARRYARITVFHAVLMAVTYAKEKPFRNRGLIFLHNS
jgi:hypothetical protein